MTEPAPGQRMQAERSSALLVVLASAIIIAASAIDVRHLAVVRFTSLDTAAQLIAPVAALVAVSHLRHDRRRVIQLLRGPTLRWFWAWTLWAAVSGLGGTTPLQSLTIGALAGCLVVMAAPLARDPIEIPTALALGGLLFLGFSLVAWAAGIDPPLVGGRLDLFAFEANQLGRYCGLTALAGLWLVVDAQGPRRLLGAVALPVATMALLATESRTSVLAFGVSLAVIGRIRYGRRFLMGILALGLLAVGGLATLNKLDGVLVLASRGNMSDLATATGRTEVWPPFIELLGDRPIAGYGIAAVDDLGPIASTQGQLDFVPEHAHSLPLQVGVGTGLIGLALFSAGVLATWRRTTAPYASALLAFILVDGITEGVLLTPSFSWLALAGLAACADANTAVGDQQRTPPSAAQVDAPAIRA